MSFKNIKEIYINFVKFQLKIELFQFAVKPREYCDR